MRSVIDYALPVYCHSLKVSEKAKLDKIQYAAKIVTGVYKQAIRLKFFLRAGLGRNKDQGQLFRIIHISFKRMGLICFFLCPSDRNHKIQLLMITLYLINSITLGKFCFGSPIVHSVKNQTKRDKVGIFCLRGGGVTHSHFYKP